ncbi:MAG TPA: SDR family NAD(P)-dependent oxidoreductase [Candidatus Nanopelagicaceae bacterium]|nr:SDR family NAD(P)-dependent oxidoreductase [Candidatus Nanopelagicaceae bacterium]
MKKVAVVTGAGSGIGAAIARELAKRDYHVVATDLNESAAASTAAELASARAMKLDVTKAADSIAVANSVIETEGRLDVWVSNAGVSKMARFTEITEEMYDFTLGVNLKGVFLAGQAAASSMIKLGTPGVIVNVASMAGKQGRVPFLSDYVASKFGVIGLTQAMAFELAAHQIRVNSVCPGYVATPMQARELAWEADLRGASAEDVRRLWIADTPLARLEEPEDVAKVVGFLASEDAAFITGEAIAINGGAFMD